MFDTSALLRPGAAFHVHTYRCCHAKDVPDDDYIVTAIREGFKSIWFTDHGPFPGYPHPRMGPDEIGEYIMTLTGLKEKYADRIDVHIGLEMEYYPSQREWYEALLGLSGMELLILGQHMWETSPGVYSCDLPPEEEEAQEAFACGEAMIEGMKTGLFAVCAHPDRIFKHQKEWTPAHEDVARRIIGTAAENGVLLEKNRVTYMHGLWSENFWALVPHETPTVYGFDAHSPEAIGKF